MCYRMPVTALNKIVKPLKILALFLSSLILLEKGGKARADLPQLAANLSKKS